MQMSRQGERGETWTDLLVRLCAAAGIFLGLRWAIGHQPNKAVSATAGRCVKDALRAKPGVARQSLAVHCTSHELTSVIASWLVPIAVGAVLGLLAAIALVWSVRLVLALAR